MNTWQSLVSIVSELLFPGFYSKAETKTAKAKQSLCTESNLTTKLLSFYTNFDTLVLE